MSIEKMSSFSGVHETGTLYLVPTPIGNLGDMTERAVRTLKEVDLICAEDTRNTQKLLNHFEIDTPQISFHEHNTKERIPQLIEKLLAGRNLAQVSDAGMPSISDPGHELVVACIENRIPVAPLPGPNAALTALIASGLLPQPFLFYGFLPRRNKEQREELEKLNSQTVTLIFYEAPHRLKKTVQAMADVFGPDRRIVLCRELTKRYEEFLRGTLLDALEFAEEDEVRGEFVLIVEGNSHVETPEADGLSETTIEDSVNALIESGKKPNDAIKEVARRRKMKKQEVYNIFHHLDD